MSTRIHYSLHHGVIQTKLSKTKRIALTAVATLAVTAGFAAPTFAAGGGYCVNSANGCAQSMSNTPCAGHGAFGAFSGTANDGQQGSAVHGYVLADKAAGVSLGSETGPANSSLCGDPHN